MLKAARPPLAITGLGCRVPGATGPRRLWELLERGGVSFSKVPGDRWDDARYSSEDMLAKGRYQCGWGGFIDDPWGFDWRAFRMPPREARHVDPQHRLLLEVAWEALEDAGLDPLGLRGASTGVFVGICWNDYQRLQLRTPEGIGGYAAAGTPFSFASSRLSHFFGLCGPSIAIDTNCASSMAALHYAGHSLWAGEIDRAIVGGVNLMLQPDAHIAMSKAGVLSPSGQVRTMDADADGFVRGEGAVVLVLERAPSVSAERRTYALVHGTSLVHNGPNDWIMAPSADSQVSAIRRAWTSAGVDADDVAYVEMHGTAFPKGDGIEASSIAKALGTAARPGPPCGLGSIKSNIGNLEGAASAAGLAKVALAIHQSTLPPTAGLKTENPDIPFADLGLAPQRTPVPWPSERPLAGVHAVSFSGTNGHAVVGPAESATRLPWAGPWPLPVSAFDRKALAARCTALAELIQCDDTVHPGDLAFTMMRHTALKHRRCAWASTREDAVDALLAADSADHAAPALLQQLTVLPEPGAVEGLLEEHPELADWMASVAPGATWRAQLAHLWCGGVTVDWRHLVPEGHGSIISLPPYPWQRTQLRVKETTESPAPAAESAPASADPPPTPQVEADIARQLRGLPAFRQRTVLTAYVCAQVAKRLGLERPVLADEALFEIGMDSITALELRLQLGRELGLVLSATFLLEHPTCAAVAEALLAARSAAPAAPGGGEVHGEQGQLLAFLDQLEMEYPP